MKTAYIVKKHTELQLVKHQREFFRFKRPDELAETIEFMMNELPDFDKTRIDDVMVGNAMPGQNKDLTLLVCLFNGIKSRGCSWSNCKPLLCIRFRNDWYGYSQDSIRNGTLYYCRWCREHEFYSDGRVQITPDYAVAKQQETKITTGEWVNSRSSSATI
jgi:hypothetical protein